MRTEVKKCHVKDTIDFLAKRDVTIEEAKEILETSLWILDNREKYGEKISDAKIERMNQKGIEVVWVFFVSMITAIITTLIAIG